MEWFIENYGAIGGIIAAFVLAFDRAAKIWPTINANGEVSKAYRLLAVLGLKVKDRP